MALQEMRGCRYKQQLGWFFFMIACGLRAGAFTCQEGRGVGEGGWGGCIERKTGGGGDAACCMWR